MDEDSTFLRQIVQYLEGVHMGKFLTGTHQEVHEKASNDTILKEYVCPTETLPTFPPKYKNNFVCQPCAQCRDLNN